MGNCFQASTGKDHPRTCYVTLLRINPLTPRRGLWGVGTASMKGYWDSISISPELIGKPYYIEQCVRLGKLMLYIGLYRYYFSFGDSKENRVILEIPGVYDMNSDSLFVQVKTRSPKDAHCGILPSTRSVNRNNVRFDIGDLSFHVQEGAIHWGTQVPQTHSELREEIHLSDSLSITSQPQMGLVVEIPSALPWNSKKLPYGGWFWLVAPDLPRWARSSITSKAIDLASLRFKPASTLFPRTNTDVSRPFIITCSLRENFIISLDVSMRLSPIWVDL